MAVCLVTGGAGFIGSHLVEALVARRDRVRVLDDFSSGSWSNLENVRSEIELVTGDVNDRRAVRAAVEGVDVVFHLACATIGLATDPLAIHHSSATGTLHILEAARDSQVSRVVYAGAGVVYRDEDDRPRCESDATLPRSLYAAAKLAAEHYCMNFSQQHGLETVRLRYFHVFGARQPAEGPHASTVAQFLDRMKRGLGPLVPGDGSQTRDFTYVEDVVQANLLAADAPRVSGKVFNIASGQAASLLELADLINKLLGAKLAPVHVAARTAEPRHLRANIERAQIELGFCPCTDLPRDLRRCLREPESPSSSWAPIGAVPVPATLQSYRPDGPKLSVLNPPHHWRDRTYRHS
jgi:UDP-glucose 4-epimerase